MSDAKIAFVIVLMFVLFFLFLPLIVGTAGYIWNQGEATVCRMYGEKPVIQKNTLGEHYTECIK